MMILLLVFRSIFPNGITTTIDNVGHWIHLEDPKTSSKIISEFIFSLQ